MPGLIFDSQDCAKIAPDGSPGSGAVVLLSRNSTQKLLGIGLLVLLFMSWIAIFPIGASAASWYDGNWQYRKEIAVRSSKVPGDLTDFPILISITDSDVKAGAQLDGDDILLTTSDGITQISHEIEKYDSGTGELIVWAKAPALSSSVDTVFYLYYGNSGASNQQDAQGVWDTNYKGVYHLPDETSSTISDSTNNSNDGTKTAADNPLEATGKIGEGQEFDGSDYINVDTVVDDTTLSGNWSVSGWVYYDVGGGFYFSFGDNDGNEFVGIRSISGDKLKIASNMHTPGDGSVVSTSAWHHIALTHDGTNLSAYLDGALDYAVAETGIVWGPWIMGA